MASKVIKHLKGDIKTFKKEVAEDKKLIKSLSSKHKKHEKKESKKHERAEDKDKVKKAMKHPNKLGAGTKKRKKLPSKLKIKVVMKEFKRGTLSSGSGKKVTNPKQAVAIALSEARKSTK